MKKILVTGGAGFIGSHLSRKLIAKKRQVIIVDNFNSYYSPKFKKERLKILLPKNKYKLYKIDITNWKKLKKIFQKHKPEIICHLAAIAGARNSLKKPQLYAKTNIIGTLNLLELAKDFKVKNFVYASSSSVYGDNKKIPFAEKDITDYPASPYGATKKTTELLAYIYQRNFKLPCTGLRFFTVYGPWGRPDMAYFQFAQKILQNKEIELYNYGNMKRDFTYIDDIVDGIYKALNHKFNFQIFNLGNNHPIQLKYFVKILEKYLNKKAKIKFVPMHKGDVLATWANIKKTKEKLSWEPKTDAKKGLKKFCRWFKSYYGNI